MSISCIICAFNEGRRIGAVLDAVAGHPLIAEIIVVDDGSTDDTAAVVARYAGVRLVSHPGNLGKSRAIASGTLAARHEWLMFLDADLRRLTGEDVAALARPVLTGIADVSMSLRGNSSRVFHAIGLDPVSGERVIARGVIAPHLAHIARLPPFGVEVFLNHVIVSRRLRVAVVRWPRVSHARKTEKLGRMRGLRAEVRMIGDVLRSAPPAAVLRQVRAMRRLRRAGPRAEEDVSMKRARAGTSRAPWW